ncbi:hypothetical protein [Helicobacter cetorum]|uniref:hypothetical protein n=1 Tax=Helicobacter cetorum TaxID=138563 RepID=UPI000CF0259A|nr:hypothetical protein [Helicobacter cetorum]
MWVVMILLSNRLNGKNLTFDYQTNTITLEIIKSFKTKEKLETIMAQISKHVQLDIELDYSSLNYNLYSSERLSISLSIGTDTYLLNNFSTIDKAYVGLFDENGYVMAQYRW